MNQKLLDYIRHLSKQDRKSLVEKTLKTAEEVGELAKVTLPYASAYATNHRFVAKERILEEAVDTILCALSVAYDLDFTDEEVESMMKLKSEKWAYLQQGEADLKYPLPFEIHITVAPNGQSEWSVDYFKDVCKEIGVKPIMLDLQNQTTIIKDVMTSSTHFGNNASAYNTAQDLAFHIRGHGFEVARVKIETVPWHPASPKRLTEKMPPDCYFEAHIPVVHNSDLTDALHAKVQTWNKNKVVPIHLSRNAFKKHEDGTITTMITYRTETLIQSSFEHNVNEVVEYFGGKQYNWVIGKVHKEFSIYDTKKSHDAAWLLGEKHGE